MSVMLSGIVKPTNVVWPANELVAIFLTETPSKVVGITTLPPLPWHFVMVLVLVLKIKSLFLYTVTLQLAVKVAFYCSSHY